MDLGSSNSLEERDNPHMLRDDCLIAAFNPKDIDYATA